MKRGVCVLALVSLSGATSAQSRPPDAAPEEGWSGSATIIRQGSGPVGDKAQGFHQERLQLTLRPDGTASYVAHYEWRIDVPQYAPLRSSGSTSGDTTWGMGFTPLMGGAWDVGASGGEVQVKTDMTSVSQALADWFVNALQAPELQQKVDPVVDDETRVVQGFMDVVRLPATASSLTGGYTRAIPMGAADGNLVPLTETVTWSLTKGRVDPEPRVTIYGPACGCLDADNPSSTTLTFTAGATRRGGEFRAFVITPEGQAPTVIANVGGTQPRLELQATLTTKPVSLRIAYVRNGRTYESAPFRVEFCAISKVRLDDESGDYAFSSLTARLTVNAEVDSWLNGEIADSQLTWTAEQIGSPTRLTTIPDSGRGHQMQFRYDALPDRNDDFGPKRIEVSLKSGSCDCARERTIRAFFVADDTKELDSPVPNWFRYWSQTDAMSNEVRALKPEYRAFIPSDPTSTASEAVAARWDGETEKMLFSEKAARTCLNPSGPEMTVPTSRAQTTGIDCFGELVLHEWQHRKDFIDWWGSPRGPHAVSKIEWLARDFDLDLVPNAVEDQTPGCSSTDRRSCPLRPRPDLTDGEMNAYWTGWSWPIGKANRQDWSCGGVSPKQWKGSRCQ